MEKWPFFFDLKTAVKGVQFAVSPVIKEIK